MKKRYVNLQMFADDATTASAATTTATDTTAAESAKESTKAAADQKPGAKYDDKDVDKIIARKFKEWTEKKDKEVAEAKKLAEMNAQQKAEYERDQMKKELEEFKRKDAISEMSKEARRMLSDSGVTVPDELLSMLVTTDAESTKAAVDGFAKLFKETVENAVKERLKGTTPKTGTASNVAVSEIDKRIKKYL